MSLFLALFIVGILSIIVIIILYDILDVREGEEFIIMFVLIICITFVVIISLTEKVTVVRKEEVGMQELYKIEDFTGGVEGTFFIVYGRLSGGEEVYRYYYYDQEVDGYVYGEIDAEDAVIRFTGEGAPRIVEEKITETTYYAFNLYARESSWQTIIYIPEDGLLSSFDLN